MLDLKLSIPEAEYITVALLQQKYDCLNELLSVPRSKEVFGIMLESITKVVMMIDKIKKGLPSDVILRVIEVENEMSEHIKQNNGTRFLKLLDALMEKIYSQKEKEI